MQRFHGGQLKRAARQYGGPVEQWIDLSTGISPWTWPVPVIAEQLWRDLPEDEGELTLAAAQYFSCSEEAVLAVPGTQFAIEAIPQLLAPTEVAIPNCAYQEHHRSWLAAGHRPIFYHDFESLQALIENQQVNYAVVVNPNNPTTELISPELLLGLARALQQRDGFLLVDEAFIDTLPASSVSSEAGGSGLIILRSVGKFFGLAGIRLGFVLAAPEIKEMLSSRIPIWSVSSPARWIGERALFDVHWQEQQRLRIQRSMPPWLDLLETSFPALKFTSSTLFVTGFSDLSTCNSIFSLLAEKGLLVRQFDQTEGATALRFGLASSRQLAQFRTRFTGTEKSFDA